MPEPSLLEPFIARLERLGVPYFVTGSMAGILYGEPRLTHDVDIVVALALRDVQRFVDAFPLDEFYCPPEDVLAIEVRRGQRGHCNLIHHGCGFKADIYIAFDELHRWGLARRSEITVEGLRVSLAPVEYVILRKLESDSELDRFPMEIPGPPLRGVDGESRGIGESHRRRRASNGAVDVHVSRPAAARWSVCLLPVGRSQSRRRRTGGGREWNMAQVGTGLRIGGGRDRTSDAGTAVVASH